MADTVSKTDNFLKAIERYAEEQRTRIKTEAEDFKQQELSKAEEEGLREAYVLIQKKMTDIRTEIAAQLSRAENSSRKKIFLRRMEIEQSVFDDAKKQILEFTQTEEYVTMLEKSARAVAEKLTAGDTVLLVRKADLKHRDRIAAAFGGKCGIQEYEDITIGGLIGQSRSMGILVDETLDSRLEAQHDWFCENAQLRVTE